MCGKLNVLVGYMGNEPINRWHALNSNKFQFACIFPSKCSIFVRNLPFKHENINNFDENVYFSSLDEIHGSTISSCTGVKHQPPRIHVQQRQSIPPDGLYSVNIVTMAGINSMFK